MDTVSTVNRHLYGITNYISQRNSVQSLIIVMYFLAKYFFSFSESTHIIIPYKFIRQSFYLSVPYISCKRWHDLFCQVRIKCQLNLM